MSVDSTAWSSCSEAGTSSSELQFRDLVVEISMLESLNTAAVRTSDRMCQYQSEIIILSCQIKKLVHSFLVKRRLVEPQILWQDARSEPIL